MRSLDEVQGKEGNYIQVRIAAYIAAGVEISVMKSRTGLTVTLHHMQWHNSFYLLCYSYTIGNEMNI
jgi:hypothetical protein